MKAAAGIRPQELRDTAEQALAGWDIGIETDEERAFPIERAGKTEMRGRPREFSYDSALDAAMKLFWRKGYEGTPLSDLTSATGLNLPSLYAAFGNKQALFLKSLDRYQAMRAAEYQGKAFAAPTPMEIFEILLRGALDSQLAEGQPRGCLIVRNLMQGGAESQGIRNEVQARMAAGHQALAERLNRAKAHGDLPVTADTGALVRLLNPSCVACSHKEVLAQQLRSCMSIASSCFAQPQSTEPYRLHPKRSHNLYRWVDRLGSPDGPLD